MDRYDTNQPLMPIKASDCNPGAPLGGSTIRFVRGDKHYGWMIRWIVLNDGRRIICWADTLIQVAIKEKGPVYEPESGLNRWVGFLPEPDNHWDRDAAGPKPDRCPNCTAPFTKSVASYERDMGAVFRPGRVICVSTGGDSYMSYQSGVWECNQCFWYSDEHPIHNHPEST